MNSDSSKAPSVPPGRLRDRLKEATRSAILDAAETVFAQDGVQRARMEDVASAAGVAVGTLYNYFADREALLHALLESRRDELLYRLDAALAERKPFEQRLRGLLVALFEHFGQHVGLFTLHMEVELMLRARKHADRPSLRAALDRVARLTDEGVATGALRAEDADLYPTLLMGMLRGLFVRNIYGIGDAPTPDSAERLVRVFLHGAGKGRRS
jgi:AcrR family transcriptional regulator